MWWTGCVIIRSQGRPPVISPGWAGEAVAACEAGAAHPEMLGGWSVTVTGRAARACDGRKVARYDRVPPRGPGGGGGGQLIRVCPGRVGGYRVVEPGAGWPAGCDGGEGRTGAVIACACGRVSGCPEGQRARRAVLGWRGGWVAVGAVSAGGADGLRAAGVAPGHPPGPAPGPRRQAITPRAGRSSICSCYTQVRPGSELGQRQPATGPPGAAPGRPSALSERSDHHFRTGGQRHAPSRGDTLHKPSSCAGTECRDRMGPAPAGEGPNVRAVVIPQPTAPRTGR